MESRIMPEIMHEYRPLSLKVIREAYKKNHAIVGHVTKVNSENSTLSVKLGNGIFATLPFVDVTFYDWTWEDGNCIVPKTMPDLVGKNIQVKVIHMGQTNILVSRKKAQKGAVKHLQKCTTCTGIVLEVHRTHALIDIGNGVRGFVKLSQIAKHVGNAEEFFTVGDIEKFAILGKKEGNMFELSYKNMFAPYIPEVYPKHTVMIGTVTSQSSNTTYYIRFTPNVYGILQVKAGTPTIKSGEVVTVKVSGHNENGLYVQLKK